MKKNRGILKRLCLAGSLLAAVLPITAFAGNTDILTQRYDNGRSSAVLTETTLTPANVNVTSFAKLRTLAADDEVYTTPLYKANLSINGGTHNVVYFASTNNTVYAYDVDSGALLWSKNYNGANRAFSRDDARAFGACGGGYKDAAGNMGIIGTPVIDAATNTLYVVMKTVEGANFVQRLHALDITNGNEKMGGPKTITATGFDTKLQNQRPALLLMDRPNGKVVYIGWASYCDYGPYHGWVMGYKASDLSQTGAWDAVPGGSRAGIWQAGTGLVGDTAGNVIFATGNGSVGANQYGESVVKLATNASGQFAGVAGFWTPSNWSTLNGHDTDQGSAGVLLLPNNRLVQGGKDGILHLLDLNNLGGLGGAGLQQFQAIFSQNGGPLHIHGAPVYWKSATNGELVYVWGEDDYVRTFKYSQAGNFNSTPFKVGNVLAPVIGKGMPGAAMTVSANGMNNGVVWANAVYDGNANQDVRPGVLYAYDANNPVNTLWSNRDLNGQDCGTLAKGTYPVVANGKVLLASFGPTTSAGGKGQICVYGLTTTSASTMYEAEDLTVTGFTAGDVERVALDVKYSGGKGVILEGQAAGDFVTFNVNVPTAGSYDIRIGVKKDHNRGIMQMDSNGANHGGPIDLYSADAVFTEVSVGSTPAFNSAGTKSFRFTVTGKNTNADGLWLAIDYIKLVPQ